MAFEMAALGFFAGVFIFMMLLIVVWIVLIIWALVDMLQSKNEPTWKILWLLVILLIPMLGVILYFAIGREQKARKKK